VSSRQNWTIYSKTVSKTKKSTNLSSFYFFMFWWEWVWTQGFAVAKQAVYSLTTTPVHFALVILEMGSRELFAWASLKSVSQVARIKFMSYWHLAEIYHLKWGKQHRIKIDKNPDLAGCQWLTLVILATQKAEIRRIVVQSQPSANSLWDPILKIPNTDGGGEAQVVGCLHR
jgi:hypothetical protein